MTGISAFGLIEKAAKYIIEQGYAPALDNVGGDLSYDGVSHLYVWIGLIPGSGSTDATEGSWAMDIDCFAPSYAEAMRAALDIEALLLTPGGRNTPEMIVDSVTENASPGEVPWEDDNVYRISATYVLSARRSG